MADAEHFALLPQTRGAFGRKPSNVGGGSLVLPAIHEVAPQCQPATTCGSRYGKETYRSDAAGMERYQGRKTFSGAAMVIGPESQERTSPPRHRSLKRILSRGIATLLRSTEGPRRKWRRLVAHAALSSDIRYPLHSSTVVLGKSIVCGTGNIRIGRNTLLYPNLYLETQNIGSIEIGDDVVLSSGVHVVSFAKITIGKGCMIGEYTSIRDANHARTDGVALRDAGYITSPIVIGNEVWIGRGVTVLEGVSIGDGATVGANAVVTRNVPAGAVVVGIPARPVRSKLSVIDCSNGNSQPEDHSAATFRDNPGEEERSFPQAEFSRSWNFSESR